MNFRFEWDDEKAVANFKKHEVSFEEAMTVFSNALAAIFDDEAHSKEEMREIIVGHSANNHILLVSFTERNEIIRIISARRATKKERKDYEKYVFR